MTAKLAESYFKAADGHRRAFGILNQSISNNPADLNTLFFAYYNILGFAIELYLKAFLARKGIDEKMLTRKPLGHDLSNLLAKAIEYNFDTELSAVSKIIEIIGPSHNDYTYRYPKEFSEYKHFSDKNLILVVVERLHHGVDHALLSK